ncbi:MAG TPA: phosphopantothenoylcysteine decarboxylase [Candidatus Omnitrophica bacterium]|nr:phosphopantothenoylcysteine decarboxylase [Candidatus Omnitrophota bacterium]
MKTVVLGVTGSIACYKAAELASQLTQQGHRVLTVLSGGAQEFIKPLTFRALTGQSVYGDVFDQTTWHISLAKEADLILVAPATACFISKLAAGIVSELLQLTIISASAPVLICPAMNEAMYKNQIIQENIKKLQGCGYNFLGPQKGWLSCGHTGQGRLAETEEIIQHAVRLLK